VAFGEKLRISAKIYEPWRKVGCSRKLTDFGEKLRILPNRSPQKVTDLGEKIRIHAKSYGTRRKLTVSEDKLGISTNSYGHRRKSTDHGEKNADLGGRLRISAKKEGSRQKLRIWEQVTDLDEKIRISAKS
jgi:hypothetical protein